MSISKIKRKKGYVYRVRVRDARGTQHTKTFPTMADAKQWEREQLAARSQPEQITYPDITLRELHNLWWESHCVELGANTQAAYSYAWRTHIAPIHDSYIQDLTPLDLERWWISVKKMPQAPATKNRALIVLGSILGFGERRELLPRNPARYLKQLPQDQHPDMFWSVDEITQFLTATEGHRFHGVWLCALNTGMRRGEIRALRWDCVDLSRGLITVRRNYVIATRSIEERTKGKEIRHVPITEPLREWLVENRQRDGLVFGDWDVRVMGKNFAREVAKLDLTPITFHGMRHTFASQFMMSGGDLFVLQRLLGHALVATTQRYAHLSPGYLAESLAISFGPRRDLDNVITIPIKKAE